MSYDELQLRYEGILMEFLLILVLTPFVIVGGVILLSKGECYFCGHRFKEWGIMLQCWLEVSDG